MKTLLLIAKKVFISSRKFVPAIALLVMFLGVTQNTHAQVYYLQTSGKGNVSDVANAIKKVDYTGSNDGNVTTSFPNPALFEPDVPNNRAFIYNGFLGNRVINVVNMGTGGVMNTITLPAGIQASGPSVTAIKYDPINDWVYYVTNGNGTSATLNAIYRSKPDGTQNAALATGVGTLPQWLALDIPNNRVFIYEGVFSGRKIMTFDLGSNTVTGNAPVSNIANAIAYDPITDYIYYITSDNDALNISANDALRKIHPGGTGGEVVVKSSVVKCPQYMALDAGNNRAFVYEGYYGSSTTIRLDDSGIFSVDLTSGTTTRILDHSGLQNTPNYIRIMGIFAPARPILSTTAVSTFSSSTATVGGNLSRSDVAVTARGVVYSSSNTTPTIGGSGVTQATSGTGTGIFSASISSLSASTTYYVRAYAASGAGTTYGAVQTFTTQSNDANLSAFTISAGSLTPSFSPGTLSYTASVANANSTITITPTKNNAGASITVNTVAVTSATASGNINLNIGDNIITTVVTAADGTTTKTYTLTVNRPKAAQSITFAGTATKTYGDADFAPGASASSGLGVSYSSDNLGVATIVSGQIHIVGAGTANITASQGGDGNYLAAGNAVQALTVNKASQTITFNAIPTKTYGTADFAPGATSSAGLTISYSSDNTAVATIVSNQVHIVGQGTANITASQAGDANRSAATNVAQSLTVSKATITVTAVAKTKIYGDDDPAFTYTTSGVVGSDAPTGALSRALPTTTNRFIGTYAIDQGTLSYGTNYNITYVGANLTINKRPVTVLPIGKTKVYGDADPFLNQFQFVSGTLATGDATADQFGRAAGENVGTYTMTLGDKKFLTDGGTVIITNNYDITVQPANFTITVKPIIVTPNAQTKVYGQPDPELTYSHDALAFSDTFDGSLTRFLGEDVNSYYISIGDLELSNNYSLNFVYGNKLTITPKNINVTANAKTKTYGTADPEFDYTNDALSFSDGFTGTLTRDAGEDVGDYAITQGSLALNGNYTLNYIGANLSVDKATLTYVATPASRPAQTPNPSFTGSVSGFLNGDNQASATTGTLVFTSTATLSSPLGNYPIIGNGLNAVNYNFVQDASNSTALTITASTDATLANLTVDQGTLNPVFSSEQTSYGFAVANDVTSLNLMATVNQANASINFNGATITSGSVKNIALSTGNNNLNIIVTAQDGSTTQHYTLNVFRAYDTNNMLASLNLNGVTYSPAFDAGTLNYTAAVSNVVASTDVTATAVSPTTHIFVGGYDLATTNPVTTTLNVGETDVIVVSKAENGNERIYKVTVTRAQSADATLASIGNNTITLNTPFVSGTHTYSATVATGVGVLNFLPIATNNAAIIKVNNQALNTGGGNNVALAFGANAVTIDVTSENGVNHIAYVLNIYRLRSSNAYLSSLSMPFITTINEPFNPNVYDYTADVADSTYTGLPLTAISADENAIVKIDGTVVPRFQNYTLPIHGGPNTYHIVVTSQDTSATKTYTLVLTRAGTPPPAQSPVANLLALNVNATGFSKNFNFTIGEELTTINVPNSIAAVRVFAVSENTASTVTVNGVVLPYDTTTDLLPISVGDNVFTVVVTSEDGAHTKTYDVHVNRLPFADVTLSSLSISAGTLTPVFVPGTRSYTVSVPNNVTSIDVTPVAASGTASVTIGATQISPSSPTATVNLNEGPPTNIRVVVLAADGVNKQTYTVSVTRLAPSANLASLTLSTGILSPVFDSATATYTASVRFATNEITITPTAQDQGATISINGHAVTSGSPSLPIALSVGANPISVVSTAQDGVSTKTYSITVNKLVNHIADLTKLTTDQSSGLVLVSNTTPLTKYSLSVSNTATEIRITPVLKDENASITINGVPSANNVLSTPILLNTNSTIITTVVTAEDGVTTKTYSITVNKTGNSVADLTRLRTDQPSGLVLVSNSKSLTSYSLSVSNTATEMHITPILKDPNASMTINGVPSASNVLSAPIPLNTNPTIITTVVTAEDGVTTKTYSITVNKTGSSVADLTKLTTDQPTGLVLVSNTLSQTSYSLSVSNTATQVRITPVLKDVNASITINGVPSASNVLSAPILLNANPTIITTVVTAEDGVTTKTYSITVNKTGNSIADLTKLTTDQPSGLVLVSNSKLLVNYSLAVSGTATQIRITPVLKDVNASITINGVPSASNVLSSPIPLNTDPTIITTVVTAEDGVTTKTYSITVNKSGNNVTDLTKLTTDQPAGLVLVSNAPSQVSYSLAVSAGTTQIRITPVLKDVNASISINGVPSASNVQSAPISVTPGATTITTVVTAEDGITTKTYSIEVNRPSGILLVDRNDSKLLFANNTANNVAPTGDDGVVVHQGVSPNGDGSNDFLYIEGISAYAGNKLSIMNTSGALVFETKDYGKDSSHTFDGHSNKNGALLKPGTYFYALEYRVGKESKRKTGYVVIKY